MIYVPNRDDYACVVVSGDGVLRAYYTMPGPNRVVSYDTYYIHSDYSFTSGSQSFGNTVNVVCLETTSDILYRVDIADIVVAFIGILVICFYFPSLWIRKLVRI